MSLETIIIDARVHRAELDADLGGADHPNSILSHVAGIPLVPGDQVFDTVTGQIVEVVHVGIANVNP